MKTNLTNTITTMINSVENEFKDYNKIISFIKPFLFQSTITGSNGAVFAGDLALIPSTASLPCCNCFSRNF